MTSINAAPDAQPTLRDAHLPAADHTEHTRRLVARATTRTGSGPTIADPSPGQRRVCYCALEAVAALVAAGPAAGTSAWQGRLHDMLDSRGINARSDRSKVVDYARGLIDALPHDARDAQSDFAQAAANLPAAARLVIDVQSSYPTLQISTDIDGSTVRLGMEVHPAYKPGGFDDRWMRMRLLAHQVLALPTGQRERSALEGFAGVLVICPRNPQASVHITAAERRHPLGACAHCETHPAALAASGRTVSERTS